jgi:two-component system, NarL family, nitrate/nitrite response regulator NarL
MAQEGFLDYRAPWRMRGTGGMICVLILGPVRIYREGLAAALDLHGDVSVVGAVGSAEEASNRFRGADVVLADASTSAGVRALRALSEWEPQARVVALGSPGDRQTVVDCAEAGVSGFVAGDATVDEVVTTAEAVARGEAVCTPRVAATLLHQITTTARQRREPSRLTSRESEILSLIDNGLSNKEIAAKLYIEVSTVKNHVHNILEKLGARRRSEAAAWVRRESRIS